MKVINIIIILLVIIAGFLLLRSIKVKDNDKKTESTKSINISVIPQKEGKMPSVASPTAQINNEVKKIAITTSKGDIELELYPKSAPKTVENFLNKVKSGFYNNLTFHRVEDWVIQGGDPLGNGTGGGDMPTELNDLPFATGSLGVARGQDIKISNDSQFFIVKKDSNFLDGQYTNFGKVAAGIDVVNKIEIGDKIIKIIIK